MNISVYKIPIECAVVIFPFVAFILTIPFLLYQYRKYGAIPFLKSAIFYSFILYLICALFLVILPLPSIKYVETLKTPWFQLKPFKFICDFINIISRNNYNIKKILTNSAIYTVIFNIFLTIPFGVYLRYFFKKNFFQTLLLSFLLSTFFEITQLSGLYGIYPRPYRLFDIDDLIVNTIGGILGYLLTPIFEKFLPSRDELEQKSYEKGKKVTLLRRIISTLIDVFMISIFIIISKLFLLNTIFYDLANYITILLYYLLIPLIFDGQTLGKKILKIKVINYGKNKFNITYRYIIFSTLYIYIPETIRILNLIGVNKQFITVFKSIIFINIFINLIYYIFSKEKMFLYEKFTKTKNVSIIDSYN